MGATLHCGAQASHCNGFSCCRAQALGTWASVVVARGFSSCGSRALERRLSSCGAGAQMLRGMWDLPRPELKPVSPELAGGFLTTAPPGKSLKTIFRLNLLIIKNVSRASPVAQWLRVCLPMQGTRVWALVWEDPTCRGATEPLRHSYWACALEPASHSYWACVPTAHALQQEKPQQWEACVLQGRVAPGRCN